jgi:hypothetical protein
MVLPALTRNAETATGNLPALLAQTQQTVAEFETTLNRLRHTWALSGSVVPEARRLSPGKVKAVRRCYGFAGFARRLQRLAKGNAR